MKNVIAELPSMKKKRVIEIACGGCELSRDLLKDEFDEIDDAPVLNLKDRILKKTTTASSTTIQCLSNALA